MQPDRKTIDKLAGLAQLEFDEMSGEEIIRDLTRILAFVDKLKEVDTEGVEPLIYLTGEGDALRKDEVKQEITREEALSNAPKHDSVYFRVPKVIAR